VKYKKADTIICMKVWIISIISGAFILGAMNVIFWGDSDEIDVPPDVRVFYDECEQKGGNIKDIGGVKAGLPTTEEGYTCWYDDKQCWDFLTYSRERFKGGANHCAEENLINKASNPVPVAPPAIVNPISPLATEFVGTWNGVGTVNFSGSIICTQAVMPWSATLSEVSDTLVQGTIVDSENEWSGTLSITWNQSTQTWGLGIISDVVKIPSYTLVTPARIEGALSVLTDWIPCSDVTGQTGSFYGNKL
jgi:hypothetical protein